MFEALMFVFFIEVGWIPDQAIYVPKSEYFVEDIFYCDMDAYVQVSIFWVQVGMTLYAWPMDSMSPPLPSFFPARIDFRGAIGITYSILTIGLRHFCSRSIAPYGRVTDPVDGFYDEIFLRLEGKIHSTHEIEYHSPGMNDEREIIEEAIHEVFIFFSEFPSLLELYGEKYCLY